MKMAELNKLNEKELNEELDMLRQKRSELTFAIMSAEEPNVRKLRDVKRTIARIKTRLVQLTAQEEKPAEKTEKVTE